MRPQTWVLSNHDVVRHATRLGYPQQPGRKDTEGIGADDPQPDTALGLRRARAATTVMLALPGSAYLYQGEELGLPEATELPDEVRQDPTWEHSGRTRRGRDGCRVPVPWESDAPAYGFNQTGDAWLPQPEEYGVLAADRQAGDPTSTLGLYRELLRVRRDLGLGRSTLTWTDDDSATVLGFALDTPAGDRIGVVANLGPDAIALPEGAEVLVASGPLPEAGEIPADTAVWLR